MRVRTQTRRVWRTRTKNVRKTATVATIAMLTRPHDNVAGHPDCSEARKKADGPDRKDVVRPPEGPVLPAMP